MAAKEIVFAQSARAEHRERAQHPRQHRQGDARAARPERHHREELGLADGHQGRRHRRQGDRARGQAREHGRPDGQGGRLQDLRHRGRRHHDRHRARAGDLHRGLEAGRRRPQPDGHQARHRRGGRQDRREPEGAGQADQGQDRDRAGRHDQRQRRDRHRRHPRRGDGEGRQGRRHHRRGSEVDGDDARRGRGHAVRPRLPLAVLRDRRRAHGGRARGRVHPHPREEDLQHEGPPAAARAGRQGGPARCSSSPRTSTARRWRRWSSTSCAARCTCAPSRRRASAIAARRC